MKVDQFFQPKAFFSGTPRRSSQPTRQPCDLTPAQASEFIQNLPLNPDLSGKLVQMPRHCGKTLVVDLDETLVHCTQFNPELAVSLRFPSGRTTQVGINVRPFAQQFLEQAASLFEVVAFTASHKAYADAVLDYLDPHGQFVTKLLYRNNCVLVNGVFTKDLRVLAGRELKDIVIVDNAVQAIAYQLANGVPVASWFDDYEDCELVQVWSHLQRLASEDDVRRLNTQTFGLSQALKVPFSE